MFFFSYFMTDEILQTIVEENLYAVQKERNTTLRLQN